MIFTEDAIASARLQSAIIIITWWCCHGLLYYSRCEAAAGELRESLSLFPSLLCSRTTGIILKNEVKRGRGKSGARSILAVWKKKILVQRAAAAASANPALGVSVISKDITRRTADSPSMKKPPARPLHSLALLFLYRTRSMPAKFAFAKQMGYLCNSCAQ